MGYLSSARCWAPALFQRCSSGSRLCWTAAGQRGSWSYWQWRRCRASTPPELDSPSPAPAAAPPAAPAVPAPLWAEWPPLSWH